jgi:hypothetical protein
MLGKAFEGAVKGIVWERFVKLGRFRREDVLRFLLADRISPTTNVGAARNYS